MIIAKFFKENSNQINYLYKNEQDEYSGLTINEYGFSTFDINLLSEVLNLFKPSNNTKKLFNYNTYDVYFDFNSNFKHFLKNGIEDYELFFYNNGNNAVMYRNSDKKGDVIKIVRNGIIVILTVGTFIQLLTSSKNYEFYKDYEKYINADQSIIINDESLSYSHSFILIETDNEVNRAIEMIKASNLSEEEKKLISNQELLKDVFQYYDATAFNELFGLKLNGLNIEIEKDSETNTAGFYLSTIPNTIFIGETVYNSQSKNSTFFHEFIHLLQNDQNKYSYLTETTAELITNEYALETNESCLYNEGVKTLKLLIDIIGPEPILKGVFGRDYSMLEEILAQNLSKEEYAELMKYFIKTPTENINKENKIRNILKKLYKNIYKIDIREDQRIMYDLIYENILYNPKYALLLSPINKYYLNKSKINEPSYLTISKNSNSSYLYDYDKILNSLIESGKITKMKSVFKKISKEEYNSLDDKTSVRLMEYKTCMLCEAKVEDGFYNYITFDQRGNEKQEKISIEEAINKNLLSYYLCDLVEEKKLNELSDEWTYNMNSYIYISNDENITIKENGDIIFMIENLKERFNLSEIKETSKST